MNDKCLRELACWLDNNTDWTIDMPKIFTGVEQDKLEKFLSEGMSEDDAFNEVYSIECGLDHEEEL